MRRRTCRSAILASIALAAVAVAATQSEIPPEGRDPADSLVRAQIEQELILAESTAVMYGELDEALSDMDHEGGDQ